MASKVCSCLLLAMATAAMAAATNFDENYEITWGGDHLINLQGTEIHLTMDISSGAGFGSKLIYGSGFFHMRIKVPPGDSAGVVTAFYLASSTNNHDELDFEFLGNREGRPIVLQTNVFINGQGNREQRIFLWFDPTVDFHDYRLLWNPYQLVFFVDDKPIRVFKNLTSHGVEYPAQHMCILASLWDGESWATDGGKTKTNWSAAPFTSQFQGFDVDGCAGSGPTPCDSPSLWWWNSDEYKSLTPAQEAAYEEVKKKWMFYNYCSDKGRFSTMPPECNYS